MPTLRERELKRMQNLAYLFDNSLRIPGIGYRFGIEPLIGLVPLVGDFAGFVMASYLIWQAKRFGAPRSMLVRMTFYAALDFTVGTVPVIGDIFDFLFKPNARNMRMLEEFLSET